MTIYFEDSIYEDRSKINRISSFFKHLTIGELIESAEILYQVEGNNELDQLIRLCKLIEIF